MHDLMVGAITVKMLQPEAVICYQEIISKAISDSVA
jgi:hypothetical protein